jgi:hypothetical protein
VRLFCNTIDSRTLLTAQRDIDLDEFDMYPTISQHAALGLGPHGVGQTLLGAIEYFAGFARNWLLQAALQK